MTHPDVSVVVISYNDARRLPAAIASIQRQTLRNLEIIVVDDASTDDTAGVVAHIAEADSRVRYERLPVNSGGCSAPRNRGIDLSTAPWLMFCDSDDEYERHACKNLLLAAERWNADVVCGATYRQNPASRTGRRWHPELHERERVADGLREFPELLFDTISVDKIYRASLIRDHGLRFPEGILYEDQLFTLQAMALSERIVSIPETVYLWNVAPVDASITKRRSEFRNVESRVQVNRLIDEFLVGLDEPTITAVKNRKFLEHDLRLYLTSMCDVDDDTAQGLMQRLHAYVAGMDLSPAWEVSPALRVAIFHLLAFDLQGVRSAMRYLTQDGTVAESIDVVSGRDMWACAHRDSGTVFGGHETAQWLDVTDLHLLRIPISQRMYAHTLAGTVGTTVNMAMDLNPTAQPVLQVRRGARVLRSVPAQWTSTDEGRWTWAVSHAPRMGPDDTLALVVWAGGRKNVSPVPVPHRARTRTLRWRKALRIGWAEASAVLVMLVGRFIPQSQLVLLESHGGRSCSGSVRLIGEALHRDHPRIRQVWSCLPTTEDPPSYARRVARVSWGHAWAALRARWSIDDGTMPLDITVRGASIMVTAGAPVRRRGLDDPSVLTSPGAHQEVVRRRDCWRMVLAAGEFDAEVTRSGWGFAGVVEKVGVPRLDEVPASRHALDLPDDRAIVTYAPEARVRVPFDIRSWVSSMGESTYLIAAGLQVPRELAWAVRSVHEHEVSAFIAASDVVISDYSSLIGDASARDVPVIVFQPDREVYVDRMHGLYPGVEVFGLPVLSQTDLHASVSAILADQTGAREAQRPAREAFLADHVGYRDGHAGARAVAALMELA